MKTFTESAHFCWDEVFTPANFCGEIIPFVKTSGLTQTLLLDRFDYSALVCKDR